MWNEETTHIWRIVRCFEGFEQPHYKKWQKKLHKIKKMESLSGGYLIKKNWKQILYYKIIVYTTASHRLSISFRVNPCINLLTYQWLPNQVQLQLNWSIALRFKQGKALSHIGWSGHAEWANSALFVERKTFLGGDNNDNFM